MTAQSLIEDSYLTNVRAEAARYQYSPRGTVRCSGMSLFRSQAARDLGCLLDVDPAVSGWRCLPVSLGSREDRHVPDFLVHRGNSLVLVDAEPSEPGRAQPWVRGAAQLAGYFYETRSAAGTESLRLANAKDLLRYARWTCPLGDRVRLLAALDEHGSITVAECLSAFRETRPIAGLSSLILHRFLEIDLDEARIGPETLVRRCRS